MSVGRPSSIILASALGLALTACVSLPPPPGSSGIGYQQARSQEMAEMRDWRACRDEGFALDEAARREANPAQYLASARMLERCEADLGPAAAGLDVEERMRAFALAVQNHLKGGDVEAASRTLGAFKAGFPDRDLYYADGTSFLETMAVLTGLADGRTRTDLLLANVNAKLRSEVRRVRHWDNN